MMKSLSRILCAAMLLGSATIPAFSLDYEAKPIHWVLMAPWRTVGALGGAVGGAVSGPIDDGYHYSLKDTQRLAGTFGDEKGGAQLTAAAPVAAPFGLATGSARGFYRGIGHGLKKGWEKPFSRWSYITMEEK